jgi:hypothetical protein
LKFSNNATIDESSAHKIHITQYETFDLSVVAIALKAINPLSGN